MKLFDFPVICLPFLYKFSADMANATRSYLTKCCIQLQLEYDNVITKSISKQEPIEMLLR